MTTVLESGRKGMIIYFKNRNTPYMPIHVENRDMTLGELIGELETDTEFGRKCVVELMYWNKDLFVDMVTLGLGVRSKSFSTSVLVSFF